MLDEKAILDAAKDGAQKLGKAVLPILQEKAKLLFGLKKELENLNYTIRAIEAVVKDAAQQKKPMSNQDRDWVKKLSDVMKEGFDLLNNYWERTQKQAAILKGDYFNCANLANYAMSYPYHLWCDFTAAGRIKDIRERLDNCAKDRRMFQLRV